jgi:hypothetical protein
VNPETLKLVKTKIIFDDEKDKVKKPTIEEIGEVVRDRLVNFNYPIIKGFLAESGGELRGGAVRDFLHGTIPTDYDIYFDSFEKANKANKLLTSDDFLSKFGSLSGHLVAISTSPTQSFYPGSSLSATEAGHMADVVVTQVDNASGLASFSIQIDLVASTRDEYKSHLDFTCNAGFINNDTFGTLCDPDLFYWSVTNKVLIPINKPKGDGAYSMRVSKMYSKGYKHIYKEKSENIYLLLNYLEML